MTEKKAAGPAAAENKERHDRGNTDERERTCDQSVELQQMREEDGRYEMIASERQQADEYTEPERKRELEIGILDVEQVFIKESAHPAPGDLPQQVSGPYISTV